MTTLSTVPLESPSIWSTVKMLAHHHGRRLAVGALVLVAVGFVVALTQLPWSPGPGACPLSPAEQSDIFDEQGRLQPRVFVSQTVSANIVGPCWSAPGFSWTMAR